METMNVDRFVLRILENKKHERQRADRQKYRNIASIHFDLRIRDLLCQAYSLSLSSEDCEIKSSQCMVHCIRLKENGKQIRSLVTLVCIVDRIPVR